MNKGNGWLFYGDSKPNGKQYYMMSGDKGLAPKEQPKTEMTLNAKPKNKFWVYLGLAGLIYVTYQLFKKK